MSLPILHRIELNLVFINNTRAVEVKIQAVSLLLISAKAGKEIVVKSKVVNTLNKLILFLEEKNPYHHPMK